MSLEVATLYLDKARHEWPKATCEGMKRGYKTVVNWTSSGAQWAQGHKKEILTTLRIVGFVVSLMGFGLMAANAGSAMAFTIKETFTWQNNTRIISILFGLGEKFAIGLSLAFAGIFTAATAGSGIGDTPIKVLTPSESASISKT